MKIHRLCSAFFWTIPLLCFPSTLRFCRARRRAQRVQLLVWPRSQTTPAKKNVALQMGASARELNRKDKQRVCVKLLRLSWVVWYR